MRSRRSWRQWLGRWLLAGGLAGTPGCLSCLNPVEPPQPEVLESCHGLHKCGRGKVYIFLVNSVDPLNCCNLTGVRDYLRALGFYKTYYGQLYHTPWFKSEICRIHKEDPDARFVLVGFSLGGEMARSLAECLKDDDVHLDLLMYVNCKTLGDGSGCKPDNVARVVNVSADHLALWKAEDIDGAENIHLPDACHFGAPTHPLTLETLTRELIQVAASVPVLVPPAPAPPPETAPTPRPVKPQVSETRDEWDFLKPVTTLTRRSSGVDPKPIATPATLKRPPKPPESPPTPPKVKPQNSASSPPPRSSGGSAGS